MDYGSNDQLVEQALNNIQASYNEIIDTLFDGVQRDYVEAMKANWASGRAQQFFRTLKDMIEQKVAYSDSNSVDVRVREVFEAINSAAVGHDAENENGTYVSKSFSSVSKSLSVDDYPQKFGDGFSGIKNSDEFVSRVSALRALFGHAATLLQQIKRDCDQPMLSPQEVETLQTSVESIISNIRNSIDELAEAIDNCIINEEGSSKEFSDKVVTAFSGGGC